MRAASADAAFLSLHTAFCSLAMPIDNENPIVFFDVSIGGQVMGRIKCELFADTCPKTVENFRYVRRFLDAPPSASQLVLVAHDIPFCCNVIARYSGNYAQGSTKRMA